MITLKWHGELPDLDFFELELVILQDIKQSLGGLEKPSDLVFHTVFLGSTHDGPTVMVWGEPDDNKHYHCQYYSKTEWNTLNEEETDD